MSINATSPSTLFGGTWERLKDQFLLAAGDTYPAGSTGGEAEHTLTVDEMPSHTHAERIEWSNTKGWGLITSYSNEANAVVDTGTRTGATGGGKPHNNMPPYLAVYAWKRTA